MRVGERGYEKEYGQERVESRDNAGTKGPHVIKEIRLPMPVPWKA